MEATVSIQRKYYSVRKAVVNNPIEVVSVVTGTAIFGLVLSAAPATAAGVFIHLVLGIIYGVTYGISLWFCLYLIREVVKYFNSL